MPSEACDIGTTIAEISLLNLVRRMEMVLGKPIEHNIVEYPDSYPAADSNRRSGSPLSNSLKRFALAGPVERHA